jgi:hypothetical protein
VHAGRADKAGLLKSTVACGPWASSTFDLKRKFHVRRADVQRIAVYGPCCSGGEPRPLYLIGAKRNLDEKSMVTLLFATRFCMMVWLAQIYPALVEGVLHATMRVAPDGPKKRSASKSRFLCQGIRQAGVPFTSSNFSGRKTR